MNQLDNNDLAMIIRRIPTPLLVRMKEKNWAGKIMIGGGFIRSVISGEKVNDIDIFCPDILTADLLARTLALDTKSGEPYKTDNAYTVRCSPIPLQIIHRWVFKDIVSVSQSFDFTICCAAVAYDPVEKVWRSYCDSRFYPDLAGKRLVYRSPIRNEDAGGSTLRVLKYYQKGFRIPLNSMGAVLSRLFLAVDWEKIHGPDREMQLAKVLTGLLREVDPSIDPDHIAHLPAMISSSENPEPDEEN